MTVKRLVVLVLSSAALAAALPTAAGASHSWGTYHWARTANPFTLQVGDNLTTADWRTNLQRSVSAWSSPTSDGTTAAPPKVVHLAQTAGSSNKRCSTTVGTAQVCNGKYGDNGWLGLATIYLTGGTHITQASAKMNDTYFGSGAYNTPSERLHVMCQEVGHTFGLGHTSEDGSSQNTCMDYFSNTGANASSTQSTLPNQHDFDQLVSIYSHFDTSTTLASAPVRSAGQAGRADARPYRVARHDHHNHSEVVEDFADGSRRVTDVVWANGPRTAVATG